MRKLLPFFACLLLVLTGWSGIAHASEAAGAVETTTIEMSWHVEGDGDQVPADADKDYPHHHASCHGHDVGTPSTDRFIVLAGVNERTFGASIFPAVVPHDDKLALRPPQS